MPNPWRDVPETFPLNALTLDAVLGAAITVVTRQPMWQVPDDFLRALSRALTKVEAVHQAEPADATALVRALLDVAAIAALAVEALEGSTSDR